MNSSLPVGSVIMWMASSLPPPVLPDNWWHCHGQFFDVGLWPDLAVVLNGNAVPDMRGMFVRGWS